MSLRVLVTRPEGEAAATAERLRALGHQPLLLPLSEIRPLAPDPVPGWEGAERVAATSANALHHAPSAFLAALAEKPFHAVGPNTAAAARATGFRTVLPGGGDAAALAAHLCARGGSLLYLAGRVRRRDFEAALRQCGVRVITVETYDTVPLHPSPAALAAGLGGQPVDAVLLYSASAAERFTALRTHPLLHGATIFALSPRIAEAAGVPNGLAAKEPNEPALLALLADWAVALAARRPTASFQSGQT